MTLSVSPDLKEARSTANQVMIDGGSGPGKIEYYSAPRADPGDAPSGGSALLATMTLTDPCGTVDGDGLNLTAAAPCQAVAAGTIDWARITDSDGNWMFDGDVRKEDDVDVAIADYIIDESHVYVGSFVTLVSALIAEGG